MLPDFRERGQWLAKNVLPHEDLIRSKLRSTYLYGLDIEDVIQEMYTRFLTVPELESIRHPRQYALLVARGIIVDHVRHSRVISITSIGEIEELEVPDSTPSSEERLKFRQEFEIVCDALTQLPEDCRETIMLRRIEGLPQREVARRLKISEKMVEKHMANGVRLLIKLFGRGGKPRINSSNRPRVVQTDDDISKSTD
jgi:RNA polymerase sigma-70 factor (ECF subfamily)